MIDATWNLTHVDDESDLTELSSDEEDVLPPTPDKHEISGRARPPQRMNSTISSENPRKTTRLSTQEATQKSRARTKDKWPIPAVESRQTISFSASILYDLINKGMIELNPEYQRGIVWSDAKQSNFINSLYHRFHAPEIVFNITYDPDTGSALRTCMDGKQRLTSICNFFDGKIPLMPYLNAADAPGYAKRKFWSMKNGGTTRPLIPPHVMENLKTTPIACVEYSKLSPDLEREIFQRVQHGVPLTPSDRLPAINGPWADVVRELRNRMNTTEGFEGYLDWGLARGKDFQSLAQFVYLAVNGTSPKKAYPSTLRIETFLNSTDGKPSTAKSGIINTMDVYCRIARTPSINKPLTKNLSPLEFVMAAFLISQHRTSLTDHQLSDAVCKMREHAQRRTEDMKFSQPNFKVFSDFVLRNIPKLVNQLAPPKDNEKPAAYTPYKRRESAADRFKYNVNLDAETGRATPPITKASGKRKRTEDDDNDDADWILEAPASTSRAKKPPTKVDLSSKVANRQRDAESKARTTVKKSPQKSMTRNPAINTSPPLKLASPSKIDDRVGRPSIRPTPSMAVQQASGSALPQLRSPTTLSGITSAPQAGRPVSSSIRNSQPLRANSRTTSQDTVNGGTSSMGIGYGPRSYQRQDQSTVVVTCNPPDKVSRNPPNVGGFPSLGAYPISPALPYLNRRDTQGSMTPGTQRACPTTSARDAKQTWFRPSSSRGGIPPLEEH